MKTNLIIILIAFNAIISFKRAAILITQPRVAKYLAVPRVWFLTRVHLK